MMLSCTQSCHREQKCIELCLFHLWCCQTRQDPALSQAASFKRAGGAASQQQLADGHVHVHGHGLIDVLMSLGWHQCTCCEVCFSSDSSLWQDACAGGIRKQWDENMQRTPRENPKTDLCNRLLSHLRDMLQLNQHALDWPPRILLVHSRTSISRHNPHVLGVCCMEDVKQL